MLRKPLSCSIEPGPVRTRCTASSTCKLGSLNCGNPHVVGPLADAARSAFVGKISFEDFGTVVRAVGLNPTEKELEGAGNGEKDLGAVQAFVKQLDESKPSKSDVESKVSRQCQMAVHAAAVQLVSACSAMTVGVQFDAA